MDHNDKRNNSVPLGTFGRESQENPDNRVESFEPEYVTAELEALAALQPERPDDPTIPRFRLDSEEVNPPRPRVRTLLGVPAFDFPTDAENKPLRENLSASISNSMSSPVHRAGDGPIGQDVRIDIDLDDDLDAAEVTMVTDSDVVSLPDSASMPPEEPTGSIDLSDLIEVAPAAAVPVVAAKAVPEPEPAKVLPLPAAAPAPVSIAPAALSSLAPREVQRPAVKPAEKTDSSSKVGMLAVAAVLLLAAGGWFLTAGSWRRATITEAPAAPQTQQPMAVSQPLADTAQPTIAQPTAAEPPATPPVQPPSEASTPAPEQTAKGTTGVRKPGVAAPARSLKVKRTPQPVAPAGDIPETPARGQVLQRLESVRSSVQACAAGRSGVADLDITIAHTGTVMHVLVGGDFAGTTQGSCIARAVREARFPSFKQERFRLLYPYAI